MWKNLDGCVSFAEALLVEPRVPLTDVPTRDFPSAGKNLSAGLIVAAERGWFETVGPLRRMGRGAGDLNIQFYRFRGEYFADGQKGTLDEVVGWAVAVDGKAVPGEFNR
jgi:hypothetical protein